MGKIGTENVRRGSKGVFVQLVGRKGDKLTRVDPWHTVSCGGEEWCVACEMWKLVRRSERKGRIGEEQKQQTKNKGKTFELS